MGSDNAKRAKLLSQWPAEKLVVLPLMFAMLLCTVGIAIAQYNVAARIEALADGLRARLQPATRERCAD